MAELSQIELGGVVYDLKDLTAREVDTSLSSTSRKPLANYIIYNMIADCAVNWRIDENTGLARLVNRFGEDIGDALDIMSNKLFHPKLTNLMDSRTITVGNGTSVVLSYNYVSIDDNEVADGPGTGTVVVNNVSGTSFSVPQGNNTVDVTSRLSAGENSVKVRVTNSEGTSRELIYNVIVLSLSVTSDLNSPDAYYGNVEFHYTVTGYGASKTVHFEMDGTELATDTITTSGIATAKTIPSQTAGQHTLRIWAVTTVNGLTVISDVLTLSMIWATAALPAITLGENQYAVRYFNYDGAYLYGYAANAGTAGIDPVATSLISEPSRTWTATTAYIYNGWNDLPASVSKNVAVMAAYLVKAIYTVRFMNGSTVLQTVSVVEGNDATYTGATPTNGDEDYVFTGWLPLPTNIQADTDCVAQFVDTNTPLIKFLKRTNTSYEG